MTPATRYSRFALYGAPDGPGLLPGLPLVPSVVFAILVYAPAVLLLIALPILLVSLGTGALAQNATGAINGAVALSL